MNKILKYITGTAVCGLLFTAVSVTTSAEEPQLSTEVATTSAETTETTLTTAVALTVSEETSFSDTTAETTITAISTEITGTVSATETTVSTTAETTASSHITGTLFFSSTSPFESTVAVTCPEITPETVPGWNNINEKWFYFDGIKFLTGKQFINEEVYIFAGNGALRTGWQTVNAIRRSYYDPQTHSPVYGWIDYNGHRYYNDKNLGKLTGMREIDGNTYIFSSEGIMSVGFVKYENFIYYCNEKGLVQYGSDKKTVMLIGDNYYIITNKGYVLRGWQTVNGKRYFYDYETGQPIYGWAYFKDNAYYFDKENGKYTGIMYIDGHPYLFAENGILQTGFRYFEDDDVTSYFYEDGTRAVSELMYTDNGNYYFDENGYMHHGWATIDRQKYYFDKNGKMAIGFYRIDSERYYFDSKGIMYTGLKIIDGKKYFFGNNGVMKYGWHTVDGKKYYFSTSDGTAYSGWQTIDGETYFFHVNNEMATGFFRLDGENYYFGDDGKMRTGWQTIDGDKYYFSTEKDDRGAMYTYRHNIDGTDYLFYSTGVMATDGNQKIVVKALSQLGQEGGEPYWRWWGFSFRIEWCACFVSWCANQCGYTQNGQSPEFISCKVGIDWFKAHNQWKGRNYTPKSGDYIFFDWEPDGIADHIGIVDYYEDGYVYTVEGNSSDEVRKRIYDIKSENIYGFASPYFT